MFCIECGADLTNTYEVKTWTSNGTEYREKYPDFPWHASIYNIRTKEFVCSGTIIHISLILSG